MAALGLARESEFFHSAQRVALSKHVGKLVDNGLLPQSALAAIEGANPNAVVHSSGIPTTIRTRPPTEFVYNHVQSLFPSESPVVRCGGKLSFLTTAAAVSALHVTHHPEAASCCSWPACV